MTTLHKQLLGTLLAFGLLAGCLAAFPRVPVAMAAVPATNRAAIQAAIDAAEDFSTVVLPKGVIELDRPLILRKRNQLRIVGSPEGRTYLQYTGPVGGCCVEFSNCLSCEVEKIHFITSTPCRANPSRNIHATQVLLNGTAGLRLTWDGQDWFNTNDCRAKRCIFQDFDYGIQIGDGGEFSVSEHDYESCDIWGNVVGILIDAANAQNNRTSGRCRFSGNGTGVYVRRGGYHDSDSIFLNGYKAAIYFENCVHSCTLLRTWEEQNGMFIDSGGPTGTGFPLTLLGCQFGSGMLVPGKEWMGRLCVHVQHPGPVTIIGGQLGGGGPVAPKIAVGGQIPTPLKVEGLKAYCRWDSATGDYLSPFMSMNDTMIVNGTWHEADIDVASGRPPRAKSVVGLVSPTFNLIYPPGQRQSTVFGHRNNATGDWSQQSGYQILDSQSVLPAGRR